MNIFWSSFVIIIGGTVIYAFYQRRREEDKLEYESLKPGRKTYLIEPLMLPFMLIVVFIMLITVFGTFSEAINVFLPNTVLLFIHISIYYMLLLIFLPLLRKFISAYACAMLWLVPTLLYFLIYLRGQWLPQPLLVITIPRKYLYAAMLVWLCGFILVFLWELISHFRFRRLLCKSAEKFTDDDTLSYWRSESKRHGIKHDIPILVSENVNTPLTIGCFDRSMRLFLPKHNYTRSEFELIFSHELRHILRSDARTKLFLGFCAAICWFNPLCWIAIRKAADDLELSCDEAILSNATEDKRRQYAELILKSAGTRRGYTTCLSASARTMRYRLRNIVKQKKRLPGGIAVGAAMTLLISTFGIVALSDSAGTGQALLFNDTIPSLGSVVLLNRNKTDSCYTTVYGYNEEALSKYLASLHIRRVYAGNFNESNKRMLSVFYGGNGVWQNLDLHDGFITVHTANPLCRCYIVDDKIDWSYIESLLDFDAPNPYPRPQPPELFVCLSGNESYVGGSDGDGERLAACGRILSVRSDDPNVEARIRITECSEAGGCFGMQLTKAKIEFSYAPSDYTVTVENWDRSESYTLKQSALTYNILPLAPYSAHYIIRGSFDTIRNTHYEMEFYFDIGQKSDSDVWEKP